MGNLTAEKNRIQKVLEAANVKIGNIVSDVFGVSGQSMLKVLLSREEIAIEQIADLSKRRLRQRIPELIEALQGHSMNKHHRWLIEQSVEHAVLLDRQIEELEARIEKKLEPFQTSYELLQTIPGVKEMIATSILAETGGRYEAVRFRQTPLQLGWYLFWKQPFGRKKQTQPDQKRQQIPAGGAGAGRLGGGA